ncbi:hypothetical protein Cgig2_030111 [Carnegiea gigantea]|uniref:Protein SPIRAL1-like 5 n=1 Tax=Carnegiea gigantea TaxID=171969 RepID=A0A9Q1Q6V8_9CARY|nr:hypothetical protein Cgig2_030111 [Carnegiea gigantea]
MNRGASYGGGQSSLGYLFGSGEGQQPSNRPSSPSKVKINPPYGIDIEEGEKMSTNCLEKQDNSNSSSYQRAQGQNSGKFITVGKLMIKEYYPLSLACDRPSTKVKSVPGGNSSLGYLFGDNYMPNPPRLYLQLTKKNLMISIEERHKDIDQYQISETASSQLAEKSHT